MSLGENDVTPLGDNLMDSIVVTKDGSGGQRATPDDYGDGRSGCWALVTALALRVEVRSATNDNVVAFRTLLVTAIVIVR